MGNVDTLVRIAAGLAAVALVAAPVVMAAAKRFAAWVRQRPEAPGPSPAAVGVSISDMRIVLELASRLRDAGCEPGVKLCQQLLDVMLTSPGDAT